MPVGLFDWELELFVPDGAVFERINYLRQQLLIAGGVEVLLLLIYFSWNLRILRQITAYQRDIVTMGQEEEAFFEKSTGWKRQCSARRSVYLWVLSGRKTATVWRSY